MQTPFAEDDGSSLQACYRQRTLTYLRASDLTGSLQVRCFAMRRSALGLGVTETRCEVVTRQQQEIFVQVSQSLRIGRHWDPPLEQTEV